MVRKAACATLTTLVSLSCSVSSREREDGGAGVRTGVAPEAGQAATASSSLAPGSGEHAASKTGEGSSMGDGMTRPRLPGSFVNGWELFKVHCLECHGEGRRGSRIKKNGAPADLRDPLMLATQSDEDLSRMILDGIAPRALPKNHKKRSRNEGKGMPAFDEKLSRTDTMDLVAFMRGDSIYLEECLGEATHYVRLASVESEPQLLAGYHVNGSSGRRPVVLPSTSDLPEGARLVGHVLFTEIDLPGPGPTPIALLSAVDGIALGARVALPEPDNRRAQDDLEALLAKGPGAVPKLRSIVPDLEMARASLGKVRGFAGQR